ncbi:hypothetical protein L249_7458 [Ophiocordyceps polyrhachis-furcata BCC 54312]|uniref:Uncharacterized protein n=1 Tax=Ophiocordyceps polyrhachis-furcata BCC 54312 TaxID=1330021 RepID=A0A367LBQ5_9HYPO|nr:hypothetical protein L249_7458 [Ophiocordyceps polyrhachis-furcata BCC 54312]
MCMIWVSGPSSSFIAARELGKSDFLSVGHDFSMRKNVGKKWEEEGGEKLVEMEMMMSNQGVDHVIEKKKTNHVMVVLYLTWKIGDLEEDFNVMDQPDDLTLRADRCDGCLVPRLIGCYDRYRYSAPIAITSRSGAMTAIAPL